MVAVSIVNAINKRAYWSLRSFLGLLEHASGLASRNVPGRINPKIPNTVTGVYLF